MSVTDVARGITEGGAIDRTIAEHRAICDALEQRRPELAQAWMTVHLASVKRGFSRRSRSPSHTAESREESA